MPLSMHTSSGVSLHNCCRASYTLWLAKHRALHNTTFWNTSQNSSANFRDTMSSRGASAIDSFSQYLPGTTTLLFQAGGFFTNAVVGTGGVGAGACSGATKWLLVTLFIVGAVGTLLSAFFANVKFQEKDGKIISYYVWLAPFGIYSSYGKPVGADAAARENGSLEAAVGYIKGKFSLSRPRWKSTIPQLQGLLGIAASKDPQSGADGKGSIAQAHMFDAQVRDYWYAIVSLGIYSAISLMTPPGSVCIIPVQQDGTSVITTAIAGIAFLLASTVAAMGTFMFGVPRSVVLLQEDKPAHTDVEQPVVNGVDGTPAPTGGGPVAAAPAKPAYASLRCVEM